MTSTIEQRKQLNEAAHLIHFHIAERCARENLHIPVVREIRDYVILALINIEEYKNRYKVDIRNRDMIKYFAFSIALLIPEWDSLARERSTGRISGEIFYLAFYDFLASIYTNVNFSEHPDIPNTCRILKEMVISGNVVATYTFFKGISETCLLSNT